MANLTGAAVAQRPARIIITDVILLAAVCLVPAFSHIISYPLHNLDPMRVILFAGLLATGSRKNAFVMAATLPLFSFIITGHPVFPKNLAIIAELMANVALFSVFSRRLGRGLAMFSSILASKVLYYSVKAALIGAGLLSTSLVDTSLLMQLLVAALLALAFSRN